MGKKDKIGNNGMYGLSDKSTPTQWVKKALSESIANGTYPANSFLPPQRRLAEELNVTRGAVRNALDQLRDAGVVEPSRGRGTRVLPREDRPARKTIAYIHTPLRSWGGMEPHHIREGVLRRLLQVGCDCAEVSLYLDRGMPAMYGETARAVTMDQIPDILKEYSAFLFHEASPLLADHILELVGRNIPVVVANLEIDLDVSATCVDHEGVSIRAVETLASFGHRHIAYLGVHPTAFFYGRSQQGFRKGMLASDLPIDETLIALSSNSSSIETYRAVLPLLQRPDPPTAIVAARDTIAASACKAIEEAGMEVGRDISVIGFDDVSWNGPEPFLTTFHEPCAEMGAVAVDMLLACIQNPAMPVEQRVLEAPLLLRRSVGPPSKRGSTFSS